MANITISGASIGLFNMTDEIRDIGNSKYIKAVIGEKPYYARLSTEKTSDNNMFVIIDNTKYFVQANPILFEPIHYEHNYTDFEQRFNVWLPKGKYIVEFNTTSTSTDTFTIPSGLNATIVYMYSKSNGVGLSITSNDLIIFNRVKRSGRRVTWFTISRQGD